MKAMVEIKSIFRELEARDGLLTSEAVVERAEPEDSILHDKFEWDDSIAGHQHRLWQARQLIASIYYEVGTRTVREYHNVVIERVEDYKKISIQGYVNRDKALSDPDMSRSVLISASKQLRYWINQYREWKEAAKPVLELVNEPGLKNLEKELGI